MPRIAVNGIDIAYDVSGKADGIPLVFAHSLACTRAMWDPQMPALASRYRLIRYDARGHGESAVPPAPYTLDQCADDAIGLIRALKLPPVVFVGLSMGGMVGQVLGLRALPELRALVLCATSSRVPPEAQPLWDERIAMVKAGGMAPMVEPTLGRWFTAPYLAKRPPEVERIAALIRATPPEGYVGMGEAIRRLDLTDRLSAIRLPTQVIVGEGDQGTPVAASEVIASKIPGAKLTVLKEAAHICNVEQADKFTAILTGFLAAIGA